MSAERLMPSSRAISRWVRSSPPPSRPMLMIKMKFFRFSLVLSGKFVR